MHGNVTFLTLDPVVVAATGSVPMWDANHPSRNANGAERIDKEYRQPCATCITCSDYLWGSRIRKMENQNTNVTFADEDTHDDAGNSNKALVLTEGNYYIEKDDENGNTDEISQ